ncbi:glycosyltransferase [Glaesserella sp.]|uniref:glycosyltransferase n=1 Tax=Glaesserella sp. TaxID=2094731 RepID=UPI00359FB85D
MLEENRKHILLVAPYLTFPDEPGANRFITIAKLLSKEFDVTLVTSRFSHFLKKQRDSITKLDDVDVVLLDEPGYKTNVSIQRFMSHNIFCKNFEKFLLSYNKKIDVAYSAYPLIKTNYILGKLKSQRGYKLIIDVQDIWPEAIAGPIPMLSTSIGKLLLSPIVNYANKTYSYADALVAVSQTYLDRANIRKLPETLAKVVFIGADELYEKNNEKQESERLLVTYIGTMSGSYDLETVVRAAPLCKQYVDIQFIGGGPEEQKLQDLNKELGSNVSFLGSHSYKEAMSMLVESDVAINPLKKTAEQSVTNKLSDYFCCGLPIVSCQENKEVQALLAQGGGIQYLSGDFHGLSSVLSGIANNKEQLKRMREINRKIGKEKFFRPTSYLVINQLIHEVSNNEP